jgi:hypothetical protein
VGYKHQAFAWLEKAYATADGKSQFMREPIVCVPGGGDVGQPLLLALPTFQICSVELLKAYSRVSG